MCCGTEWCRQRHGRVLLVRHRRTELPLLRGHARALAALTAAPTLAPHQALFEVDVDDTPWTVELALVAAGKLDAFWERGLGPWDTAAGIVLVREAGGYVTDADGGENMLDGGSICVGNEFMHRNLLGLIKTPKTD